MTHFLRTCLVLWATNKQNFISLSIVEAEYVVVASCCAQLPWIKQQLLDFGMKVDCIPIRCDEMSSTNITKNSIHHKCTKHIDVRHHFLQDNVEKGFIEMTCARLRTR